MAENLYPESNGEILAEELVNADKPVGYIGGVYFDEATGDFLRDGRHFLKSATGIESWEQWCANCLMTERDALPAYGSKFGIATREAMQADREEAETILTREITAALTNDPYGRTEYVENVAFTWDVDIVEIAVTVRGIEDVTIDINTTLDRR